MQESLLNPNRNTPTVDETAASPMMLNHSFLPHFPEPTLEEKLGFVRIAIGFFRDCYAFATIAGQLDSNGPNDFLGFSSYVLAISGALAAICAVGTMYTSMICWRSGEFKPSLTSPKQYGSLETSDSNSQHSLIKHDLNKLQWIMLLSANFSEAVGVSSNVMICISTETSNRFNNIQTFLISFGTIFLGALCTFADLKNNKIKLENYNISKAAHYAQTAVIDTKLFDSSQSHTVSRSTRAISALGKILTPRVNHNILKNQDNHVDTAIVSINQETILTETPSALPSLRDILSNLKDITPAQWGGIFKCGLDYFGLSYFFGVTCSLLTDKDPEIFGLSKLDLEIGFFIASLTSIGVIYCQMTAWKHPKVKTTKPEQATGYLHCLIYLAILGNGLSEAADVSSTVTLATTLAEKETLHHKLLFAISLLALMAGWVLTMIEYEQFKNMFHHLALQKNEALPLANTVIHSESREEASFTLPPATEVTQPYLSTQTSPRLTSRIGSARRSVVEDGAPSPQTPLAPVASAVADASLMTP